MPDPTMKRCPACGETKPLEAFSLDPTTATGRHSQCRVCHGKRVRAYRKTPEGREARRQQMARYRARNRARNLAARASEADQA